MKQRGEIATILTVISLGIMLAGILIGNLAVKNQTNTQSKAGFIKDPENINFNPRTEEILKEPEDKYFPDPEEIRKPTQADKPEYYAPTRADTAPAATAIPPQNTPIPPTPAPTGTVPLPGHSKIDCGGVGNQCNPATDDPQICGNDGCLHAAVGRPTQAPKLIQPTGLVVPTLPGRNPGACGGSWYQCDKPGVGSCGNDGCDNIKLGRPFEQPIPIPTNHLNDKPLPGHSLTDCKGAYYQCIPGTTNCGNDGCRDDLLQRGKFAVAPTLTLKPESATVIPILNPTCSDQIYCGQDTNGGMHSPFLCGGKYYDNLPSQGGKSYNSPAEVCGAIEKLYGPFEQIDGEPCKDTSVGNTIFPAESQCYICSIKNRGQYWSKIDKSVCITSPTPASRSNFIPPTIPTSTRPPSTVPIPTSIPPTIIITSISPKDARLAQFCQEMKQENRFPMGKDCTLVCTQTPSGEWTWNTTGNFNDCYENIINSPTKIPAITPESPQEKPNPTPNPFSPFNPTEIPTQTGWKCLSSPGTSNNMYICENILSRTCPRCAEGTTCKKTGIFSAVCTSQPSASIPPPQTASASDWNEIMTLSTTGKIFALQVSTWVHEAAKYYYPGIKTKYCDPSKGECDFKL